MDETQDESIEGIYNTGDSARSAEEPRGGRAVVDAMEGKTLGQVLRDAGEPRGNGNPWTGEFA